MLKDMKMSAMTRTINGSKFSIKIHKYSQTMSKYKVNYVFFTKRCIVKQSKNILRQLNNFKVKKKGQKEKSTHIFLMMVRVELKEKKEH